MRRPVAPRWSSTARSGDAPERWRCAALANASRSPRRGLWASIARGDVLLRQKTTRPPRPAGCHPSPATPRRAKRTWGPAIEIVALCLDEQARRGRRISSEQPDQLTLDAHAIGRQNSDLVGSIGGL